MKCPGDDVSQNLKKRGTVTSRYHGSKIFGLTETAICIVPVEESRYGILFCSWVQSRIGKLYMWWFPPRFIDCGSGHPLFLLRLASSDRPKFLAFSNKKKKINDVVKPLFTWNNSFNLKNEHSNNIEKNRSKNRNIFYSMLCILLIQTLAGINIYRTGLFIRLSVQPRISAHLE